MPDIYDIYDYCQSCYYSATYGGKHLVRLDHLIPWLLARRLATWEL